jgi:hypothetical protein
MKRSPLPRKRATPRRSEGRVTHIRVKPRPGAPPNAEERRHLARVAAMSCLVCGAWPVTLHHVSASIHGGRIARSHKRIVPLCAAHHQHDHGDFSVERLGHGGFYRTHGINLLVVADRLWAETMALPGLRPS